METEALIAREVQSDLVSLCWLDSLLAAPALSLLTSTTQTGHCQGRVWSRRRVIQRLAEL